ncbi:hypothetical protein AB2T90_11060 [Clostridium butyricum]|uniref:DNA polymerase III subunit beta family protein n=1 Tax=Clostridium butyricum TaxID=1492 RepID=UPI003466866E
MKTILNIKELQTALKEVNKVKKNKEIPVLANVILRSKDGQTVIEKDNGFTRISKKINSSIEESGAIALQENTIKIISKLQNNDIVFTQEKITTGTKTIRFKNQEYIKNTELKECKEKFKISEKELYRLLEVSYCTAEDDTRPILKGVNFKQNKTCALDGYRMSIRTTSEYFINSEFTVNNDSISVLKSILNKKSKEVVIGKIYNDCVVFTIADTTIQCKFINGNFMRYETLIPQEVEKMTTIKINDIDEIKKSIDILKEIKNERNSTILMLKESDKKLMLSASNKENEMFDVIQQSEYINYNKNHETEIWCNCKYVSDMLKIAQADNLYMSFRNAISPILIYENDNLENFELILPVRKTK